MSTSHNPVMNRMLPSTVKANQAEVDAQFDQIVSSQKMTIGGVAIKMLGLFALLLAGAFVAWNITGNNPELALGMLLPTVIVTLVLSLVISFSKNVHPVAVVTYAVVEGFFIGVLSFFFEDMYPGIVMNAVLGTLVTAGAMFLAYSMGWIKVTSGFTKAMMFALIGYALFGIGNLIFGLFTNSAGFYSGPYAWVAGLVGVGLAAFCLNLDFNTISKGVEQGLPREFEWRASFGLLVTMVWLYLEILRLLAIFNRD